LGEETNNPELWYVYIFLDQKLRVYSINCFEIKLVEWRKKQITLKHSMCIYFWTESLEYIPSNVLKLNWWNGGRNEWPWNMIYLYFLGQKAYSLFHRTFWNKIGGMREKQITLKDGRSIFVLAKGLEFIPPIGTFWNKIGGMREKINNFETWYVYFSFRQKA